MPRFLIRKLEITFRYYAKRKTKPGPQNAKFSLEILNVQKTVGVDVQTFKWLKVNSESFPLYATVQVKSISRKPNSFINQIPTKHTSCEVCWYKFSVTALKPFLALCCSFFFCQGTYVDFRLFLLYIPLNRCFPNLVLRALLVFQLP